MTKAERQLIAIGLANLKLNAINNAKLESIQNMVRKYNYEEKDQEKIKILDKELQAIKESTASDLPQAFEIFLSDDFDLQNLRL